MGQCNKALGVIKITTLYAMYTVQWRSNYCEAVSRERRWTTGMITGWESMWAGKWKFGKRVRVCRSGWMKLREEMRTCLNRPNENTRLYFYCNTRVTLDGNQSQLLKCSLLWCTLTIAVKLTTFSKCQQWSPHRANWHISTNYVPIRLFFMVIMKTRLVL